MNENKYVNKGSEKVLIVQIIKTELGDWLNWLINYWTCFLNDCGVRVGVECKKKSDAH
jgi:hypothetical protein